MYLSGSGVRGVGGAAALAASVDRERGPDAEARAGAGPSRFFSLFSRAGGRGGYRPAGAQGPDFWTGRFTSLNRPRGFVEFSEQASRLPADLRTWGHHVAARPGSQEASDIALAFATLGPHSISSERVFAVLETGRHAELLQPLLTLIKYALIDIQRPVRLSHAVGDAALSVSNSSRPKLLHRLALSSIEPNPEGPLASDESLASIAERFHGLAEAGANLNVRDAKGQTPLHYAVMTDNAAAVRALASAGARLNVRGKDGMTPIMLAVHRGAHRSIAALLEHDARLDLGICGPGQMERIKHSHLLDDGGLVTRIRRVSERRPRVEGEWSPVHWAAHLDGEASVESLRLLMAKPEMAGLLTPEGESALHIAARKGNEQKVKYLLRAGVDPNVFSQHGDMPLHVAVAYGAYAAAKRLARDPRTNREAVRKPPGGVMLGWLRKGPVEWAMLNRNQKCAQVLFENGVEITPDRVGFAVKNGLKDLIGWMVERGVDLNRHSSIGWLPIHYAGFCWDPDMVTLLVRRFGCNVDAQTLHGDRAIEMTSFASVWSRFRHEGARWARYHSNHESSGPAT